MNYLEFRKLVPKKLAESLQEGTIFTFKTITKNNDFHKDSLVIREPGEKISPALYLEDVYSDMIEKELPFEEVIRELVKKYKITKKSSTDVSEYNKWENAKERIIVCLINKANNREYLQNKPYVDYLDLAVIFKVLVDDKRGLTTTLVTTESMNEWNVTTEELLQAGLENTRKLLKDETLPIYKAMMLHYRLPETHPVIQSLRDIPMWCVTNIKDIGGAYMMLYPDIFQSIAAMYKSNLQIIPSSVHELLVIPQLIESEELSEMIGIVNDENVPTQDVLSDHPYIYNWKTGRITY